MGTTLIVLHYFVCTFLIGLILIQAGKGADMGAAFGGASQTVFGGRGPATFLSKMTTVVAVLFLMSSITLAHMSKTTNVKSVFDNAGVEKSIEAPVVAEPPAAQPVQSPEAPTPVAK